MAAAKARTKIPWWAMPVVGLLPLWVLLYAWALKPSEETVAGPLGEGEEIYSSCASCHGTSGAGGVGRQLNNGEVLLTFPTFEDHASLVYTGSAPYDGKVYGDPDREGGPHLGGSFNGSFMPQQGENFGGALTDAEIIAVVCHERYTLGGADPLDPVYAQEFADWCAPAAPKFEAIETGESTLDEEGISTAADRSGLELVAAARSFEVLVIGGGPAGASAAYWLARHGHDVAVVERKTFPREKTCGDGLTPRAVKQLQDMGLGEELAKYHRFDGLRCTAQGRALELPWPEHPVFPPYGYVVRRRELDWMVAQNAEVAGATLLQGTDALGAGDRPRVRAGGGRPIRGRRRAD